MTSRVLVCVDGSELSLQAAASGLTVLHPEAQLTLVTVIEEPDPTLVTGGGFTGSTMSEAEYEAQNAARVAEAQTLLAATGEALGVTGADTEVLSGPAGPVVCDYAEGVEAEAIVIGSRGHGGIRRAILGSVSDHIVRHAPCTVLVTGHDAVEHDE